MDALVEMTGLDRETCASLLEAAGGDVETALAIFFERQEEPSGGGATSGGAQAKRDGLVFETEAIPRAWAEQDFKSLKGTMNVLQRWNGPCGVLACLLAQVAADRFERAAAEPMDREVSPDEAKRAFFAILSRCGGPNKVVQFRGRSLSSWKELSDEDVSRAGCLVDLVQGLVATRTEATLRRDVGQGELPLVSGPHALCTSELVSLLMRGTADGNLSAFNPLTGAVLKDEDWTGKCGFGLLTRPTEQAPVANGLLFPRNPVWVVHGGDHFTVLIRTKDQNMYLHLNGLPPAGPSSVSLSIRYSDEAPRVTTASSDRFSYVKPVPGEVEDIVQAHPEDRAHFKDEWRRWRLECVLAVEDPSVQDSNAHVRNPAFIKRFELGPPPSPGSKFRCAACYRDRFRTMNFGEQVMESGQKQCTVCGKDLASAQWSIWLAYEDLPRVIRARADRMFAPKLLNVLRTRWVDADVAVLGNPAVPLPST